MYLIFDRYRDYSIKSSARTGRASSAVECHNISLSTPLSSQHLLLSSTSNKRQLIEVLVEQLASRCSAIDGLKNSLILTGHQPFPIEVFPGSKRVRNDLKCTHKEADTIIVQQCFAAIDFGAKCVKVISDDTDVLLLLLHFYEKRNVNATVIMESTTQQRKAISISEAVKKSKEIIPSLLRMHALTGCDTVAQHFGIGKGKAFKVLKTQTLQSLGEMDATLDDVYLEATAFIAQCYGIKNFADISAVRYFYNLYNCYTVCLMTTNFNIMF